MAIDLSKPWHYIANGQTIGPISGSELVSLIGRGIVQASTKVWTPGQTGWLDASAYPDLFSASAGMAPPPPPMDMPADQVSRHDERWTSSASTSEPRSTLRPAGFWIRVVAYVIDSLVISGLLFGLYYYVERNGLVSELRGFMFSLFPPETIDAWYDAFVTAMRQSSPQFALSPNEFILSIGAGLIGLAVSLLYFGVLQGTPLQATIGKALVGIRLMRSQGGNVGLLRSLWRYLMTYLSSLLFGLGFLIAAFNRDKKALHDFLSGTRVVYRRR